VRFNLLLMQKGEEAEEGRKCVSLRF